MDAQKYPSPFYQLLEGATSYELGVPDVDYDDPREEFWADDGSLRLDLPGTWTWHDIGAVSLGESRYRFAADNLLCSGLALRWGDEFLAEETSSGVLEIRDVVVPMPFKHLHSIGFGPIPSGSDLEKRIHEFGGGWMTVAGGILTITIPVEHWEEFNSTPHWKQLSPGKAELAAQLAYRVRAHHERQRQDPRPIKAIFEPRGALAPTVVNDSNKLKNAVDALQSKWRNKS